LPRDQKKWDTHSVPQSEVTWDGIPCLENMWIRNSFARFREVMVSWVGTNIACLHNQSMMTRMAMKRDESGSFSMKSMEMEFQGFSGIGSCLSNP
jgi:hypothetical protein